MEEGEEPKEEEKAKETAAEVLKKAEDLSAEEAALQTKVTRLMTILQGSETILQHLQFLISNNKSDMQILRQTKDLSRHSISTRPPSSPTPSCTAAPLVTCSSETTWSGCREQP